LSNDAGCQAGTLHTRLVGKLIYSPNLPGDWLGALP